MGVLYEGWFSYKMPIIKHEGAKDSTLRTPDLQPSHKTLIPEFQNT